MQIYIYFIHNYNYYVAKGMSSWPYKLHFYRLSKSIPDNSLS